MEEVPGRPLRALLIEELIAPVPDHHRIGPTLRGELRIEPAVLQKISIVSRLRCTWDGEQRLQAEGGVPRPLEQLQARSGCRGASVRALVEVGPERVVMEARHPGARRRILEAGQHDRGVEAARERQQQVPVAGRPCMDGIPHAMAHRRDRLAEVLDHIGVRDLQRIPVENALGRARARLDAFSREHLGDLAQRRAVRMLPQEAYGGNEVGPVDLERGLALLHGQPGGALVGPADRRVGPGRGGHRLEDSQGVDGGRPVRCDDLAVGKQIAGVLEDHDAVAKQGPALLRMAGHGAGRLAIGGVCVRTLWRVWAHGVCLLGLSGDGAGRAGRRVRCISQPGRQFDDPV